MLELYPEQRVFQNGIYDEWATGKRNVLGVYPTGGGKCVISSDVLHRHVGHSVSIAHRKELIGQSSLTLARYGVKHRIIAPKSAIKFYVASQIQELGTHFYDPSALCAVAGVDTLVSKSRASELAQWANQVTLWHCDEAHHLLRSNKWGRAVAMFPNAFGLGVTANTIRADGRGLGRAADGVFDALVVGLGMRDLIGMARLTDYRIFAPPSDLDLNGVKVSDTTGDYNQKQLKQRIEKSHIVGDVVDHYLRLAKGKLGITFATDVETASIIAARFNAHGVRAACISAKTPEKLRVELVRRFKNRELDQLVNVDLFGEGFDLPAIEVVSMARPTESYNLFCQQFGRSTRIMEGKDVAIIIDHVGNTLRHGLPDAHRVWTLDRRESRAKAEKDPNIIPTKTCPECLSVYESIYKACPHCGHIKAPAERSGPEFVDGDLTELSPEALAVMRGEIKRIDEHQSIVASKFPHNDMVAQNAAKNHVLRQKAQWFLRASIALWAGYQRSLKRTDSEIYRRFYFRFGVDVGTAKTLNKKKAEELTIVIDKHIEELHKCL